MLLPPFYILSSNLLRGDIKSSAKLTRMWTEFYEHGACGPKCSFHGLGTSGPASKEKLRGEGVSVKLSGEGV